MLPYNGGISHLFLLQFPICGSLPPISSDPFFGHDCAWFSCPLWAPFDLRNPRPPPRSLVTPLFLCLSEFAALLFLLTGAGPSSDSLPAPRPDCALTAGQAARLAKTSPFWPFPAPSGHLDFFISSEESLYVSTWSSRFSPSSFRIISIFSFHPPPPTQPPIGFRTRPIRNS